MMIVGSMALLIPALYWGVVSAQSVSGTAPYAPAYLVGQLGIGAAAAGPFMVAKGGHHGGGNFRFYGGRGFYGGSYYPYGGYPFYGDNDYSYDDSYVPTKTCVWNGYEYKCYRDYDTD